MLWALHQYMLIESLVIYYTLYTQLLPPHFLPFLIPLFFVYIISSRFHISLSHSPSLSKQNLTFSNSLLYATQPTLCHCNKWKLKWSFLAKCQINYWQILNVKSTQVKKRSENLLSRPSLDKTSERRCCWKKIPQQNSCVRKIASRPH